MRIKIQFCFVVIGLFLSFTTLAEGITSAEGRRFVLAPVTVKEADAISNTLFTYPFNPTLSKRLQEAWRDRMLESGVPKNQYAKILEWYSPTTAQEFVDKQFPGTGFKANNIIDVMAMELLVGLTITKQLDGIPLPIQIDVRNSLKKRAVVRGTLKDHTDKRNQEVTEWTMLDVIEFALNRDGLTRGSAEFESLIARVKEDLDQRGYRAGMIAVTEYGLVYREWVDKFIVSYQAEHGEAINGEAFRQKLYDQSDKIELKELGLNSAD